MEAIQKATRRLESISKTARSGKGVEDALIQLSSTIRLLEQRSISTSTFAILAENLRGRLLPLYRVSLPLTVDYAVAVLRFIHSNKLVHTLPNLPDPWESLLISLLSGLLDVLDENPNNKTREMLARAFYPVLCPLYFAPKPASPLTYNGELLSMVYQILTATVTSHPRNAATLREHAQTCFGFTILQTKDFLALESLLDLFGSLIPSSKGGRGKRTAFIKDIFAISIFKDTGNRIRRLLEDISNPDWSVTSEKILSVLAEHDISFPQPFKASGLLLDDKLMDCFSPFYVDKKQFIINIDKDGSIETLSIPYSITKSILVSTSTTDTVEIILQLTKSPMLGNQPVLISSKENLTISWKVKKPVLPGLEKALKSRDMSIEKPGHNKLSKVKPIEFGFHYNKEDSQTLTKKRLEQLSQSWAIPASPKNGSERETFEPETSPLLPVSVKETSRMSNDTANFKQTEAATTDRTTSSSIHPSLGNQSPQPEAVSPERLIRSLHVAIEHMSDEDEAQFLPNKFKKRLVIVSDDEGSVDDDSKFTNTFDTNSLMDMFLDQRSTPSVTTLIKPSKLKNAPVKTSKFRLPLPCASSYIIDLDDSKEISRLPKHRLQEESSPISARPHKRVKYSRKGRVSSPTLPRTEKIDFEEIPKPQVKNAPESSTKTKALGMKDRKGKAQIKSKALSKEKKFAKIQLVNQDKAHENDIQPPKESVFSDPTISSPVEEVVDEYVKMSPRRSLRASTLRSHIKEPPTKSTARSVGYKKPKRAPWEDEDFIEKAKLPDALIATSDPFDLPSVAEAKEQNLATDLSLENVQSNQSDSMDNQDFYEVPKVPEGPRQLPNLMSSPLPASKAIMIDLTIDSPLVPKRAPSECVCKAHPAPDRITTETNDNRNKTPVQHSPVKIKIPARTLSQAVKVEEHKTETSVPLPAPKLKIESQKIINEPLALQDENERPIVNIALPHSEPVRKLNKKNAAPVTFDTNDWEHHRRDNMGYNVTRQTQNKIALDPMKKILEVVQQINEVIVHNIENRFEKVTEHLSAGQRAILEATANNLQEMHHESIQHFDDMVDLEGEYAAHCDVVTSGTQDYIKSSEQLVQCFKDICLDRSCRSLSKKLPLTLFPKIPAIIMTSSVKL